MLQYNNFPWTALFCLVAPGESIMGASGNVTGFIMPWEELYVAMSRVAILPSFSPEDPTWPSTLELD